VSLEHSLFRTIDDQYRVLNATQGELFRKEFGRLEWEGTGSQNISAYYRQPSRNNFLYTLVFNFELVFTHPAWSERVDSLLIEKALQLTPENLKAAASEWKWFAETLFIKQGRPIPDWPEFVTIQRRLRLYAEDEWEFEYRLVTKKKLRRLLKRTFKDLAEVYPNWKWAARMQCYFTAALSQKYILPSGQISCL
jgi:hypothetical protein